MPTPSRKRGELLSSALVDMAETHLLDGDPLPLPNPQATSDESDLEEPIHLFLTASPVVEITAGVIR